MCADYWVLRRQRIKLTNLYHPEGSVYWYTFGINWRVIPAWICGWAPTIGGLIVSVRGNKTAPRGLYELYYMAFFIGKCIIPLGYVQISNHLIGFSISFVLFLLTNLAFPVKSGMRDIDEADVYGTFTNEEADALGVISADLVHGVDPSLEKEGAMAQVAAMDINTPSKRYKVKEWLKG